MSVASVNSGASSSGQSIRAKKIRAGNSWANSEMNSAWPFDANPSINSLTTVRISPDSFFMRCGLNSGWRT